MLILAALTGVLAASAPAAAAGPVVQACSGSACDGRDPAALCQADAATVASTTTWFAGSQALNGPLLELRYSRSCRAAWARISGAGWNPGDSRAPMALVHRNSDGREYQCVVARGSSGCYTPMVNDANVTSFAFGRYDAGAWVGTTQTASY